MFVTGHISMEILFFVILERFPSVLRKFCRIFTLVIYLPSIAEASLVGMRGTFVCTCFSGVQSITDWHWFKSNISSLAATFKPEGCGALHIPPLSIFSISWCLSGEIFREQNQCGDGRRRALPVSGWNWRMYEVEFGFGSCKNYEFAHTLAI